MSGNQKVYQRNKMCTFVYNSAKQLNFNLSLKSEKSFRETHIS